MKNFHRLAEGIPVDEACGQILAQPHLWDRDPERTVLPNSPHAQSSDIWLRFRAKQELTEPARYAEPHFAVFYPAWHDLPALHPIVFRIMAKVQAVYLGGILITKIPPGKVILPHVDTGWHPEFMNCKAYVILQANDGCFNHCEDETVIMRPGEAWLFNNRVTHSVENRGEQDRIALITTMRVER